MPVSWTWRLRSSSPYTFVFHCILPISLIWKGVPAVCHFFLHAEVVLGSSAIKLVMVASTPLSTSGRSSILVFTLYLESWKILHDEGSCTSSVLHQSILDSSFGIYSHLFTQQLLRRWSNLKQISSVPVMVGQIICHAHAPSSSSLHAIIHPNRREIDKALNELLSIIVVALSVYNLS